jgi:hypothetical protein
MKVGPVNFHGWGLSFEEQRTVVERLKAIEATTPKQCEHVKANGEFCGSPALGGRHYCYFHLTHIGRRIRAERARERAAQRGRQGAVLELPPLEDADSIQIALMQVIDAVLNERVDAKRGGLVLYALQTASSNLRHGSGFRASAGATVAGTYEDFEADYELGDEVPELKVEEVAEVTASDEGPIDATGRTADPSAPAEAVGRDDKVEAEAVGRDDKVEATVTEGPALAKGRLERGTHGWSADSSAGGEVVGRDDRVMEGERPDPMRKDALQCGARAGDPVLAEEEPEEPVEEGTGRMYCDLTKQLLCSLIGPATPAHQKGAGQMAHAPRAVRSQRVGRRDSAAKEEAEAAA